MAAGLHDSEFKNPAIRWIDQRLPIFTIMNKEYGRYPTPKNFTYMWSFGALALFMLVTMIVTGIALAMHYKPSAEDAFDSVELIMRDVNFGWLLRYVHANGASMFFIVVFIHIGRGLYYGSYKTPRELVWMIGVTILLLLMATAFMGYVLPWGQMSFWGATVITGFFTALPVVGESIQTWLLGGYAVDDATLNRFFALHYLLPFVIAAMVFLHVVALHISGSGNPTGVEPKSDQDTIPFHPYYTIKDIFALIVFLIFFSAFVFYAPNYLGHPDNYIPADPLKTPAHIVPEWYFLPFYAILRAITFNIEIFGVTFLTAKLGGVIAMFASIAVLFLLPWLDTSPVRSANYRPMYRVSFWVLVAVFVLLGICGGKPAEGVWVVLSQIGTAYWFFHFLVLLPWLSRIERPLPLPASISEAVLRASQEAAAVEVRVPTPPAPPSHGAARPVRGTMAGPVAEPMPAE